MYKSLITSPPLHGFQHGGLHVQVPHHLALVQQHLLAHLRPLRIQDLGPHLLGRVLLLDQQGLHRLISILEQTPLPGLPPRLDGGGDQAGELVLPALLVHVHLGHPARVRRHAALPREDHAVLPRRVGGVDGQGLQGGDVLSGSLPTVKYQVLVFVVVPGQLGLDEAIVLLPLLGLVDDDRGVGELLLRDGVGDHRGPVQVDHVVGACHLFQDSPQASVSSPNILAAEISFHVSLVKLPEPELKYVLVPLLDYCLHGRAHIRKKVCVHLIVHAARNALHLVFFGNLQSVDKAFDRGALHKNGQKNCSKGGTNKQRGSRDHARADHQNERESNSSSKASVSHDHLFTTTDWFHSFSIVVDNRREQPSAEGSDKETEEEGDRDEDRVPLVHLVVHHGNPQVQEYYAVAC